MEIKRYDSLPQEAKDIREKVFVEEQGFKEEFDAADGLSVHLVAFDCGKPVATCRFYRKADTASFVLGRIAVVKEMPRTAYRGSAHCVCGRYAEKRSGFYSHSRADAGAFLLRKAGIYCLRRGGFRRGLPARLDEKEDAQRLSGARICRNAAKSADLRLICCPRA